jgi:hypothetical protein
LPTENIPVSPSCLDDLDADFKVVKLLGHGDAGGAVLVEDEKAQEFVAKYLKYGKTEAEVACAFLKGKRAAEAKLPVQTFRIYNPYDLFMQTYSWARCDHVPEKWQPKPGELGNSYSYQKFQAMMKNPGHEGFLIMFSNYAGEAIRNFVDLSPDDIKSVLFEIIFGLMELRNDFKFNHNDLAMGNNILIRKDSPPRIYKISRDYYEVKSKYRPTFIDFGRSSIMKEVPSTDIPAIKNVFERLIKGKEGQFKELSEFMEGKVFQRAMLSSSSDGCSLRNILEEPYFDSLRRKE